MKLKNTSIGVGVLSAVAASLCCITPLLALIAGTSGAASSFSWLEPLRPYLIGFTVLVIGFAWYQKLKPKKVDDCGCDEETKEPFLQSKLFLGIVTVFAALMLTLPYYSHVFYPETLTTDSSTRPEDIMHFEFEIEGMTCEACENHITHEVDKVDGVIESSASYNQGSAWVKFDTSKISLSEITKAIHSTGYSVIQSKQH